jgi:hypothetical protein
MFWRVMNLAILIMLITSQQTHAQSDAASHPCSLLTAEQITAAVGKVGESKEGDMPGKTKMKACSWGITGGLFTLMVGKVPASNQSTRQVLDEMNAVYDVLKEQGWNYEKKDFGTVSCSLLTPPAGADKGSPMTSCATVVKGMLVMTSASSKTSIAAEKLKPLTESAAARLP